MEMYKPLLGSIGLLSAPVLLTVFSDVFTVPMRRLVRSAPPPPHLFNPPTPFLVFGLNTEIV